MHCCIFYSQIRNLRIIDLLKIVYLGGRILTCSLSESNIGLSASTVHTLLPSYQCIKIAAFAVFAVFAVLGAGSMCCADRVDALRDNSLRGGKAEA